MAVRMLRLSCISASSLHSVRIVSHCCCTLGSHSFALLLHLITQTHARALRLAPGTHGRRCYPSELLLEEVVAVSRCGNNLLGTSPSVRALVSLLTDGLSAILQCIVLPRGTRRVAFVVGVGKSEGLTRTGH